MELGFVLRGLRTIKKNQRTWHKNLLEIIIEKTKACAEHCNCKTTINFGTYSLSP